VGCYAVLVEKLSLTPKESRPLVFMDKQCIPIQYTNNQLLFFNCLNLNMCLILQNVITIYESTQHNFPYECIFSNIIVRTSNFAHGRGIHTSAVFSSLIIEQWEVEHWSVLQWQNVQYHIS